jgi:hypothetical protein
MAGIVRWREWTTRSGEKRRVPEAYYKDQNGKWHRKAFATKKGCRCLADQSQE